jgi:hypothetical protein
MPLNWHDYKDQDLFSNDTTMFKKYLQMIYYGVLFFGLNEYGPVNNEEYLFIIGGQLISVMMSNLVFGQVANILHNYFRK